ncbi:DMT family transporter [Cyanobacteria bacterium FACHB-63]|nr:DMT family transporter [Cyanobacteria bacterium FACHB-63]
MDHKRYPLSSSDAGSTMLQDYLWFGYALGAAILWGIQYATLEQLIKIVPIPLVTLVYTAMLTLIYLAAFAVLQVDLGLEQLKVYCTYRNLLLFGLVVLAGCGSTLLIFTAIAAGTATRASIIEITYPVFVAVFAALLYGEATLTPQILSGGLLILAGVALVLKG